MSDKIIYENSKNYTATVVKLPPKQELKGLDNLVGVNVMGNLCLIEKTYPEDELYLFFPSGSKLSHNYCYYNNLYRHSDANRQPEKTGYLDENGRIKSLKLKGHVSTGLLMPIISVQKVVWETKPEWVPLFEVGQEFNEIAGIEICRKYIVPSKNLGASGTKISKVLLDLIDERYFPEHRETAHFLKFVDNIDVYEQCIITEKLHGTSARTAYTLVKRQLNWLEKLAKRLGVPVVEEEYKYVVGSRHCIKSIDFEGLKNKQHYYPTDLWTTTAKIYFEGKLYKGEAVYYEIIGPDIQKGYSYGLNEPNICVYRLTNINPQGIEVDLTFEQMEERCIQLGVPVVPVLLDQPFKEYLPDLGFSLGFEPEKVSKFIQDTYGNAKSTIDGTTLMEGVCIRFEGYPQPKVYKYKSPLFLLHESKQADEGVADVETNN